MPAGRKKGDKLDTTQEAARRRAFYDTWLQNGRKGKDAAMAVGVSETSAAVMASKWLKLPEFVEELEAIDRRAREKSQITVENLVLELGRLAFVDISRAYDSMGNLKPMHEWPDDVRRACVGFEMTEEVIADAEGIEIGKARLKKVKFIDKTTAIDKLMKHFPNAYAPNKLEVKDTTDHGAQMRAAIEREVKALAERAAEATEVPAKVDE